jgi:hypothetical protein
VTEWIGDQDRQAEALFDQLVEPANAGGTPGEHDLVDPVEGGAGVEELQGPADLLGQGLLEGA